MNAYSYKARLSSRQYSGHFLWLCLVLAIAGCGSLTLEEESRLGDVQVIEIEQNVQIVDHPEVVAYIHDLAAELLNMAPGADLPYQFRIIKENGFNAFAVAGGNIYVTTGTIMASRNVAELVSVLAHEIAHVQQGHISRYYRRYRNSNATAELAGIALAIATGNPLLAGIGDAAANLGSAAFIGAHSREAESEADAMGFQIMTQAGYDPRSQVTLLSRIRAAMIVESDAPPAFLLTHPLPEDRILEATSRLQSLELNPALRVNDASRLETVKQVILALP